MFRKKKIHKYKDIDENTLKSLQLFESAKGNFNELGYNVEYTRIPGGLIRLVITPEAIDQLFIPMPASYFVIKEHQV